MFEVNIPLLRKAVEWAESEAALGDMSQWGQRVWLYEGAACGTSYCIAGFLLHQAGWTNRDMWDRMADIPTEAARLLGFDSSYQLGGLFNQSNGIEDVRRIAESLAGERL